MMQVVQGIRDGSTSVWEVPEPLAAPGCVSIATVNSVISAGTERYVVDLARKSLLAKARARPDHVRRVLQKLKQEGLVATTRQVMAKLDEPMPLGYSCAGLVLECGRGVDELKPGDRVAAAGPHAGVVAVGRNLCARVPEGVTFERAAYGGVAAIALQGVRLAEVELGARVLVIGLGLVGQISVGLLRAQGCRVLGTDPDAGRCNLARGFGADAAATQVTADEIKAFAGPSGVDAVLICAATSSNAPIELAADVCRVRGRIVLVGVAGLALPRPPFFEKELTFTVSHSLGPGRGDRSYEEKGADYPIGFARWTAQRNMEAVLEVMARGQLPVERLTTHRYRIERAAEAFDLIATGREPHIGVLLEFEGVMERRRRVELRGKAVTSGALGVSLIGAGNFARLVLMPALAGMPGLTFRGLCTAKGMSAVHGGEKLGFAFATTDAGEVLCDEATDAVLVLTRHDLHAELVVAALRAGKHVFVEKPLCITSDELASIAACVEELGSSCPLLMVGFNRRFARATMLLRAHFGDAVPLSIHYRFAPGALSAASWPQDEEVGGGRIVGEACHAIDLCTALAGAPPVRVFAESVERVRGLDKADDRVFITIRHENGSVSNISYQAGGDRAGPVERIEVFGGGRTAILDGWDTLDLWESGRRKRGRGRKDKGHAAGIEAFVRGCRSGSWPIPWSHIYGVAWASLMAVQSLRDGMPVAAAGEGLEA